MRFGFLFLFALLFGTSFGQTTDLGGPYLWSHRVGLPTNTPTFTAPGFDLATIQAEDAQNDALKDQPWRFGYAYSTAITIENGIWTELNTGDRIWHYKISCPEALTVNLLFENFRLPEGASLYLYDENQTNYVGAYTARNNRPDGALGTELIHGSTIIVEYFEPKNADFSGDFHISSVIHGYRSTDPIEEQLSKALNGSGNCQIDVGCSLGNGWENEIRSVAMIIVNGNGVCTGALINNSCEDGRPLFLTANHCLTSSTANWAFRFNWKTTPGSEVCATVGTNIDPGMPYDQTANGATVLANDHAADFALLELDQLTPTDVSNWNLYFSGWDRTDNESLTMATVIHHPTADVMKISREEDSPYHNTISSASVWWIDQYEQGSTEGGSSGAPLYDQNHRIVGQLYGGTASCAGTIPNTNSDYYGRLGVAWNYGLDTILSPGTCETVLVMDGMDPDFPNLFDDANLQFVASPTSKICSGSFEPTVILRNAGDNALTSCDIRYQIDQGTLLTFNWTGNLATNGYEYVTFPTMSSTGGMHNFHVYSENPNGNLDNNPINDTILIAFELNPNTAETHVTINTDCYGYETAWEIKDGTATILASGGNPGVPPGGGQSALSSDPYSYGNETTVDTKVCLVEGCYTFTVYDDWGDGLEGSTQSSCNVDGSYSISDEIGVVGTMQNVAFGTSETINFCVQEAGLNSLDQDVFVLYPNPANTSVQLGATNGFSGELSTAHFQILDLSGQIVLEGTNPTQTIEISGLAAGSYQFLVDLNSGTITKSFVIFR